MAKQWAKKTQAPAGVKWKALQDEEDSDVEPERESSPWPSPRPRSRRPPGFTKNVQKKALIEDDDHNSESESEHPQQFT